MQHRLTEREFVDVRHGVVPNLTPHMRSAASGPVKPVLHRKGTEVKAKPVGLLEDRNVDGISCRGLRKNQQYIAVVGAAALGMRRNVWSMCLERDGGGRRRCGKGNVGPERMGSGTGSA